MSTTTKSDFMTINAYRDAGDLPEAIALNRAFIRHERQFCHRYFTDDQFEDDGDALRLADCLEGLGAFERALAVAESIWREEVVASLERIAERIRKEVPNQDNYGDMATCVETGDFTPMAC